MTRELKLAFHYVRKYWWRYILGLAALFLVDQVNANVPLLSGELTDGLTAGTLDMGGVWGIAIRIDYVQEIAEHNKYKKIHEFNLAKRLPDKCGCGSGKLYKNCHGADIYNPSE